MTARYVPLHQFCRYLAEGWRFVGDVAEPMAGHHGAYSRLMVWG